MANRFFSSNHRLSSWTCVPKNLGVVRKSRFFKKPQFTQNWRLKGEQIPGMHLVRPKPRIPGIQDTWAYASRLRSYEQFRTFDRCSVPVRPIGAGLGDVVGCVSTISPQSFKSLRLTVRSARSVLRGECCIMGKLTITIGVQHWSAWTPNNKNCIVRHLV